MRIAFYAPLKPPDHPVVSGDREMARLLIRALQAAGHEVETASRLRAWLPQPDETRLDALRSEAQAEAGRIAAAWRNGPRPDLWFTYHPYYKSPDLIGPLLAADFSIPYVTAEASLSARRDLGAWTEAQAHVARSVRQAAVNFCFTRRDHDGLGAAVPDAALAMLPPFIDPTPFAGAGGPDTSRLVAVAMMRPGDKLDSYRMLAQALRLVEETGWTLSIVGDGPARDEVRRLFDGFAPGRIVWHDRLEKEEVANVLAGGAIHVWPGCGEAFGLAYLEAQAAGLPVVAQETAGVPDVVRNGETGLLTPAGDIEAFAAAIDRLLHDDALRRKLGGQARRFVQAERSLEAAASRLAMLLPQPAAT